MKAVVKSFNPDKGYGFAMFEDGRPNAFIHVRTVKVSGLETISPGDRIDCEIETTSRGSRVVRLLSVESQPSGSVMAGGSMEGVVKFFDHSRGYGFIVTRDGQNVFVGSKLLKKQGVVPPLRINQTVVLTAVRGQNGYIAETVRLR